MDIPLFKIHWDDGDVNSIKDRLKSGKYWATGPEIEEFESKINEYIGSSYCKTFNSGGSALEALMEAYDFGEGDEIIVPSFTFIATAYSPLYVGSKPVFADIEEETFGLDPEDVKEKITPKTKAIIPVHYGGIPCKINALKEIAEDHDITLIEDAAESFGAEYEGKKVGTFGDASVFSFCHNKIFTTGEGGCVITNNDEINEKLKLIRSYGRKVKGDYFGNSSELDYVQPGKNLRMSTLLASLGLSQLEKVEELIKKRRNNTFYLNKELGKIDQIIVPEEPSEKTLSVYQMYTIRVKEGESTRDRLMNFLEEKGISSKIYFEPIHEYSVFKELGYEDIELPMTNKLSNQVLSLPMYPDMEQKELDYIIETINDYFNDRR